CCCPCSAPLLLGLLAGALTMGVVFATILSLYVSDSDGTTDLSANAVTQTTGTSTTSTSASSTTSTSSSSTTTSTTTSTSSTSSTTSTSRVITTSVTTVTTTTATTTTATTTTSKTTTTTTTTTTTKPYCTTRVTFDDIPGQTSTSGVIPNGYDNLNWTSTSYINASTTSNSGYQNAVISQPYVAYNPGGAQVIIAAVNGTHFSFDSVVVGSVWRDNLQWTIDAYRSGVYEIHATFLLQVGNQTTITCYGGCTNLDTLIFSATGGTSHSGFSQTGTEFAFDDLCISFLY
ncbi:unnamed protein product, partial [Adineta steineri]